MGPTVLLYLRLYGPMSADGIGLLYRVGCLSVRTGSLPDLALCSGDDSYAVAFVSVAGKCTTQGRHYLIIRRQGKEYREISAFWPEYLFRYCIDRKSTRLNSSH